MTDGWRLCELLGLSSEFVRRLPNAAATDIAEALTMNRAAAPGTLDDFVGEFLKDLVDPATAAGLHEFFVAWVSGRGHYPSLRVGRQPYGLVVTSAWRNWAFPPAQPSPTLQPDVAPALFSLIDRHRARWAILARNAPHAGAPTADPFQRLLDIIGLLASSVEFASRKAVSDEYIRQRLRFGGADAGSIQQWFDALRGRARPEHGCASIPGRAGSDRSAARVHRVHGRARRVAPSASWTAIPQCPCPNATASQPYDGTHNYLHWLVSASRDDLVNERFVAADGTTASRPSALLYVLLRHALLAALEAGTRTAAQVFGTALFDVVDRDPLIANIDGQQHVLRRTICKSTLRALAWPSGPWPLGDWALASARAVDATKPVPVQLLAEAHDAIDALADLPTARLERLLAEHVDLCSYRLDAWITALYAQRLATLARLTDREAFTSAPSAGSRTCGLREASANGSASRPCRRRCETAPVRTVFEEAANGGYVHAPSLAQASSAAVLRNAYLSHASDAQPLPFAINLSSTRMRAALALTQGVRNGQPIAALLGYQLERGLHEGHPGVELDAYIGVLRDRFPLLSGRLTDLPEGTQAEIVEARNVVDGLTLVEFDARQGLSVRA